MRSLSLASMGSALLGHLTSSLTGICRAEQLQPQVKMTLWDDSIQEKCVFKDSTNIISLTESNVGLSTDFGKTWNEAAELKGYWPVFLKMDPFFPERAFVFMDGTVHFVTNDRGKTWQKFKFSELPINLWAQVDMTFHAKQKDFIILNIEHRATLSSSVEKTYYTADGFETTAKMVDLDVKTCVFPRSDPEFDSSVSLETIVCVLQKTPANSGGKAFKSNLIRTTDFFRTFEYIEHEYLTDSEILELQVESAFMVVYSRNNELAVPQAVIVSKDAKTFQKTDIEFEHEYISVGIRKSTASALKLELEYYDSDPHELEVHVSDATGLKFTKSSKSSKSPKSPQSPRFGSSNDSVSVGGVHFGTFDTPEDQGEYVSKYSIDGKTWVPLEIIDDETCGVKEGCSLHFRNRPTLIKPGTLMVSGVKGKSFNSQFNKDTYISFDGGASWKMIFSGLHRLVRSNNKNIIVAIPGRGHDRVATFHYSLNQGNSWSTYHLPEPVMPLSLSSLVDSSGTKIVLFSQYGQGKKSIIYYVDFNSSSGGDGSEEEDEGSVSPVQAESGFKQILQQMMGSLWFGRS